MNSISIKDLEQIIQNIDISSYTHLLIYKNNESDTYFLKFISKDKNIDDLANPNEGVFDILSINKLYTCYQLEEHTPLNLNHRVQKAISYATKMHQFQYRHDGSEYVNHPLRVANYVRKFKKSSNIEDLYISAILHDVIEDTQATYYDIIELFGIQVASLVLELTNNEDFKKEVGKTKYLEIKMKNMSSWALVIKLCDRLDNVSDLISSPEKFRNKYIKETIEIINYILDNRNLTQTHINIIKAIMGRLIFIINNYKYDQYHELINKTHENIKTRIKAPSPVNAE